MAGAWRLVLTGAGPGARNMALDAAMLSAHARGEVPPTLRLYRWEPPAVSLGRFQRLADVDEVACRERGYDIVRRPTGGRGVLHDDELTYAVVAGPADGIPRGVAASYRHLCAALADAYRRLGVPAELTARPRGERGAGACYLHATQADLSLGAAKLSGSAQVRSGSSLLQHGSFVVSRDVGAEAAVFRLGPEAAAELARSTATLAGALGRRPSCEEVARAVTDAFSAILGVEMHEGGFTERESEEAAEHVGDHRIGVA